MLLQASKWEAEFAPSAAAQQQETFTSLSSALAAAEDLAQADVVTFARIHMNELFSFVTGQLLRVDAPLSEVLLQGLM